MKSLSIITINFNNRDGLQKTIQSVIDQTSFDNIEYIIIDGGSSDGSKELIHQYSDKFSFWVSEKDSGIYNAMNKGVANATSTYCLFLNSGDVLHNNTVLEDMLRYYDDEVPDFIIGKTLLTQCGIVIDIPEQITMNWFYTGSLPHPSTLIRTESLKKNPYDESLKIVSDWKFFIEEIVLNNASYRFTDVLVTDFDCNGVSSNAEACAIERTRVLSELFPLRVLEDYQLFQKSDYYYNTNYDKFYLELRENQLSKWIYLIDIILVRIISVFNSGYRFVRKYSLFHCH